MSTIDGPPGHTEESEAYESGWTAYKQDLDRTDNPYDAQQDRGAPEKLDWGDD